MSWLRILFILAVTYWSIFAYLVWLGKPGIDALLVGLFHIMFITPQTVAPIRAFFDPQFVGYKMGLLRFKGGAAGMVASTVNLWGLLSAAIAALNLNGLPMIVILVGDMFRLLNLGGLLFSGGLCRFKFQAGEYFRAEGVPVAIALMAPLFLGFTAGAAWAAIRLLD